MSLTRHLDDEIARDKRVVGPIHPGQILQEEFLRPMDLSQNRLAMALHVPARRINEIVHGRRSITADTALRLARFFGTSAAFWLNLQTRYDLDKAEAELGQRLEREVRTKEEVLS